MCENCKIDTLIFLYVRNEQIEGLSKELIANQFQFTIISSSGGLLSYPNNSILIGISKDRLDELRKIVKRCCQRRTTHIATQTHIESYPQHSTPIIVEAEIGGAILNIVEVDHFEQF
jgi:uncharacterized protein YaaQ